MAECIPNHGGIVQETRDIPYYINGEQVGTTLSAHAIPNQGWRFLRFEWTNHTWDTDGSSTHDETFTVVDTSNPLVSGKYINADWIQREPRGMRHVRCGGLKAYFEGGAYYASLILRAEGIAGIAGCRVSVNNKAFDVSSSDMSESDCPGVSYFYLNYKEASGFKFKKYIDSVSREEVTSPIELQLSMDWNLKEIYAVFEPGFQILHGRSNTILHGEEGSIIHSG